MICIFAAIVFGILGIFNLSYRRLAREAWKCVLRRMTFRPCNAEFSLKLRINVVGAIFRRSQKAAAVINKYFELLSWIVIILFLVTTIYTSIGVYNYVRYQTCSPFNPKDCLIGAETCINYDAGSFWQGLKRIFGIEGIADEAAFQEVGLRIGPDSAPTKIIEFVDFQCPVCAVSHRVIDQVLTAYPDRVQLIFVNFPLPQHRLAQMAAETAVAAAEQGKLKEYTAQLFDSQPNWTNLSSADAVNVFMGYAQNLGLNVAEFKQTAASAQTKDTIEKGVHLAIKIGVNATPTHIINGKRHVGVFSIQDIEKTINEAAPR